MMVIWRVWRRSSKTICYLLLLSVSWAALELFTAYVLFTATTKFELFPIILSYFTATKPTMGCYINIAHDFMYVFLNNG